VTRRTLVEHIGRAQLMVYAAAVVLATLGASIVGYHYLHQQTFAHLSNLAQITAIESQPALIFHDDAAAEEVQVRISCDPSALCRLQRRRPQKRCRGMSIEELLVHIRFGSRQRRPSRGKSPGGRVESVSAPLAVAVAEAGFVRPPLGLAVCPLR